MLLPALARAKESGKRIACVNNLRQLSVAAQMYVDENQGSYPPHMSTVRWPGRGFDYYGMNFKLLLCPSETTNSPATLGSGSNSNNVADAAPRSYLINGWTDYFADTLSAADFASFMGGTYPAGLKGNATCIPVTQ
jgi:hypothetical protein